jgi:protein-disulfide isomerase
MNKKFWIVTALLITGIAGFILIGRSDRAPETSDSSNTAPVIHIVGEQNAAVSLVEYGDFQCPACATYNSVIENIVTKYKNRLSFEYRHYPLTTIHRNAFAAARASEAAEKQDKFWEMHRLLFINQASWSESDKAQGIFESYAKRLGLNMDRYKADFTSSATNDTINASIREFNKRGLPRSTPTLLLNGKRMQPRNAEDLSRSIDELLEP